MIIAIAADSRVRAQPRRPGRHHRRLAGGTATVKDRLQAIGTGRANATVTVNPYSSLPCSLLISCSAASSRRRRMRKRA
ncbi:hypothetical protein FJW06_01265 [Mesorhizobium sp. B4-1-3]|nr:hypothetical protein FJW06_01265 [Mesorhizobium sp. B4-1-3]